MKFVKFSYCFWLLVAVALAAYNYWYLEAPQQGPLYLLAIPAFMILWTLTRHIGRHFVVLSLDGGRLRYETGMLSKSTRTLEVGKVQDVRVDQSFAQRIVGVGTLTLETAGETGRLSMDDIDSPQRVAERILDAAHRTGGMPPASPPGSGDPPPSPRGSIYPPASPPERGS
ncbi:MAG: PH domain-containing protein [Bryobacteraceae bacterium]